MHFYKLLGDCHTAGPGTTQSGSALEQELIVVFCKGPDSKYFRLLQAMPLLSSGLRSAEAAIGSTEVSGPGCLQ